MVDFMARPRLPQQQELIRDVLRVTRVREDVERLLEHVISLQAKTVALAGAYGAKQTDLGVLMNVSRQRVGQLFDEVDTADLSQRVLEAQIGQVEEWPADVMGALATLAQADRDADVDETERAYRQLEIAYGSETAEKRRRGREAFLSSLEVDPEAATLVEERIKSARRTIAGQKA